MEPVEGVVVGGVDLGESHRIVRLLTSSEGRVSALARNARASKKRFAGMFEPGTLLRVQRSAGRGDLAVITDVDRLAGPDRARRELERIALLAYGCELVSALAPEDHPAPRLYRLLVVWLEVLEGEATPGVASRVALEGKALTFAGLAPSLTTCPVCATPLDDPVVVDAESGGGLHGRCGGGRPVPAAALGQMEVLRRTPLAQTVSLPAPDRSWVLSDLAQHHLSRGLRSRSLLEELETP